ncbi:UDP-glucuronosyltransferase 1-4 [Orchesella cincta]|uniref:UDP-glucuronosyltransferase 1-4 n=1 Tax=Orchesella cincta TaxID=48709 RepID=A0A1D2MFL6_ORCCI|nr:UDP-glucuronosyltransferase 1-4 [Orchesella cincta]
MGFFGRIQASVSYLCHFNKQFRGLPGLDLVLREKLGMPDMPPVIPIGGMHVSNSENPCRKRWKNSLKEAETTASFIAVGKIKTGFLWRWDGEKPVGMPDNVIRKYEDLLRMVTVKQNKITNAERLHRTGRGIRLDFGSLTEPQLEDAINRLLTDPRIKHEMKLTSARFKDRPSKPVDTALWWTSYIFRHEDTSFLRPGRLASSLSWYQRRQLTCGLSYQLLF